MIYSLKGELIYKNLNYAVIEVNGVGYEVKASLLTLASLPDVGKNAFLYTYMAVREDNISLYGFINTEEMSCFKMLISVSGIGAKGAMAILSELNPQKFALCVASNDVKALTKCQGIGAKTAGRIVLELKDKILKDKSGISNESFNIPIIDNNSSVSEAINALVVLGYSQSEAAGVLGKQDPNLPVEELIKLGLKSLAGNLLNR